MKLTKTLNSTINRLHKTRQAKAEERQTKQPGLFDTGTSNDTPLASFSVDVEIDTANTKRERSKFLPIRHPTRDFFLCDMFDYALKDDGASMEVPIFTLATKPDLTVWHWESKDGNRSITVTPSVQGRATQFDKDVLIYLVSQMTEALNRDRIDAKNRVVRFTAYDLRIPLKLETQSTSNWTVGA